MSKRFTDTNIWDQSWFLELSPEGKNIWQFLEKSTDCGGIWKIDIPEMRRKIGCKNINLMNFLEEVNRDYNKLTGEAVKRNRIMLIANDTKLWLTGFISFQYEKGTSGVNAGIPAIKGALNRLRDENIYEYAMKEGFVRVKGESEADTNKKETAVKNIPGGDTILGDNSPALVVDSEISSSVPVINSDLIDSSENNFKACRGSARDKDKDKDQDQEVLKFEDLNTEGEEEGNVHLGVETKSRTEAVGVGADKAEGLFVGKDLNMEGGKEENVHKEADKAEGLFAGVWGKQNKLPEEKRLVNEFINKYGFASVEFAFREGVKYNKMSLAYVDAICRKRKEKKDQIEYRNRDKKKLHESILLAEEQKKSGKCLTLVKEVYGEKGLRKAVGRG